MMMRNKTCNHWRLDFRYSLSASDSVVTHVEHIHTRLHEAINGVSGRTNDGLVLVERCIEDNRHARQLIKIGDQLVIARIHLARDRLQTPRTVNVRDGWNPRPLLFPDLVDH